MNQEREGYLDVQVSCTRPNGVPAGILNGVYSMPTEGQALLDLLSEKKRGCEENNGSCDPNCPIYLFRASLTKGTYDTIE